MTEFGKKIIGWTMIVSGMGILLLLIGMVTGYTVAFLIFALAGVFTGLIVGGINLLY